MVSANKPKSSIEQTDAESASVAKNPSSRVTLADIEAQIGEIHYRLGSECIAPDAGPESGPLERLTVAFIIMRNGFCIVGKSVPLDPANFNADLGKKFAYEDAIRQLWPLMAFARASASAG